MLEIVTGKIPLSGMKTEAMVIIDRLVNKNIPPRPATFPSFGIKEADMLWGLMVDTWAFDPQGRPNSTNVQKRIGEIREIGEIPNVSPGAAEQATSVGCDQEPKIHGLIIGINKYKSPARADLDGCVSGAISVLNYLVQDLGVPRGQILTLFDEQATRDGIITAFWTHLIHNEDIKRSDPIVIYYAGHVNSLSAPQEIYSSDGHWEFILPHDASTLYPDGSYIFGIPDRTLGALIYVLQEHKGDNITVIVDGSFSGRIVKAPMVGSFVLLAACRSSELAQVVQNIDPITKEVLEPPFIGLFTSSLLKALRQCNPAVTSYSEIMRIVINDIQKEVSRSPLTMQIPQCEGKKKDRILFQTRFAMSKGMIALLPTRDRTMFRIRAGSASGIQVGTVLSVYSAPLVKLVAINVTPTWAVLSVPEDEMVPEVPQNAHVVITKYNSQGVRILVEDESRLPPVWDKVFNYLRSLPIEVAFSKPGEPSDLVLVPAKGEVKLQRQDPSLIQLGPKDLTLRHSLGAEELKRRMAFIIRFHFHLQRRNPDSPLKGQVDMQLIELKRQINPILKIEEYVPLGTRTNLFGDSLVTGAVTELSADPDKRYGLVLTNRSKWPLYAYVLYFNLGDYSIECLYEPPSRSSEPPLTNDGKDLPVGYGSSGTDPFRIEGETIAQKGTGVSKDTGVFMLIVTSSWVDILHMEQPSLFSPDNGNTSSDTREVQRIKWSARESHSPVQGEGRPERRVVHSGAWDVRLVQVSIVE
ncbi:ICE-like protease (caspase) p20 domain protein [Ceratobasidium sp. AG-Ba]|nr:ICE-like protease (caspase) p20 domain protein [Ceratobasidium sp. AG-Ba]